MKRYGNTTNWPAPPAPEIITPARQASLGADVGVPAMQSLITGALTGAVATFIVYQLAPGLDTSPLAVWAGTSLTVATTSWLVLLKETRALLWNTEARAGVDLDGDGVVGKPQERVVVLNGSKIQQNTAAQAQQQATSGFADFVRRLPTKGTATDVWEPELGRRQYNEWRDILIDHGLARWNSVKDDGTPNKTKGWELTTPVDVILRALE